MESIGLLWRRHDVLDVRIWYVLFRRVEAPVVVDCVVSVVSLAHHLTTYYYCVPAFAYGGDDPDSAKKTFVGNTDFFLRNPDVDMAVWFFQFAFACALSSIVAGTVAERCKMTAYLFYSIFLVGFVYPVVSYLCHD